LVRPVTARLTWASLALLSLALRAVAFLRYRFDSDEPQHLHVVWGWVTGRVQYRDLFDNHAPLFHMAMAPILRLVGERPDVLLYMRAPMLLLFGVVLWGTYVLGARLYSRRVGAWAALLLSLLPPFFLKSLEFRTDNLWNALWIAALVMMTSKFRGRLFLTGLLLGLAFCVSLKTTLLVATLLTAGLVTYFFAARVRVNLAPMAIGIVIPPAIVAWWFWAQGAWPNLVYGVFRFNELLVRMRPPWAIWLPRLIYVPAMVLLLRRAWKRREGRAGDPVLLWRFFFAMAIGAFLITLVSFWILISPRDYLPILPLAAIFFVAAVDRYEAREKIAAAVCLVCVAFIVEATHGFRDGTREHITMMRQVLRLTRPGEPIMDLKGETIYRPRPYYYIFELITRQAMIAGLIPDTIERDVIRARCHVAQADGEFLPDHGRAFLLANFLDMGRLRAAGQWIRDDGTFRIAIPGQYVVVGRDGIARGLVDGQPNVPRELAAGLHRYGGLSPGVHERVAVLWAPAFARGFSPFHPQDRDF
jgi:4-amino-4-deoxy-L-arabinose transferase-like glycosyltransferase